MEIIFELLFQTIGEIVLQGLFELGFHFLFSVLSKKDSAGKSVRVHPLLAILGYIVLGSIAGVVSVLLLPMHLFKMQLLQILNLAVTPIVLGFLFEALGRWKASKDKPRYAIEQFSYGFTFALTMGLIRFFFAA